VDRASPPGAGSATLDHVRKATGRHARGAPRRRTVALAGCTAGAVLAAVAGGALWARLSGDAGAASTVPPSISASRAAVEVDWAGLLAGLDRRRSAAFAAADTAGLAAVDARGFPAWQRDVSLMERLRSTGLRAAGVRLHVSSVSVSHEVPGRVVLGVVDAMPAYWLVRTDGSVAARRPGRGPARWSLTLVQQDGRWLVRDVTRR
jgi:hypothetical protein